MAQWSMLSGHSPPSPVAFSAPILVLRVAGHSLAIRQSDVEEILPLPRLTPLPEAPPILLGVFHLAGAVVLVLPLAALLGLAGPAEGIALYHHLLLLRPRDGEPRLALRVDRVTDILNAAPALLPPGESFNDCVEGDLRLDGGLVPLISGERLLTVYERTRMVAFAARQAERAEAFATDRLPLP